MALYHFKYFYCLKYKLFTLIFSYSLLYKQSWQQQPFFCVKINGYLFTIAFGNLDVQN